MTTRDLQRTDELVRVADVAVRVGSLLRLWNKRQSIDDQIALSAGIQFLEDAVSGGHFVNTGATFSGSASLSPFTWSVDVQLAEVGAKNTVDADDTVNYDAFVAFLDQLRVTLLAVKNNQPIKKDDVLTAAVFFDHLGQFIGEKADNALRIPSSSGFPLHDRMSFR